MGLRWRPDLDKADIGDSSKERDDVVSLRLKVFSAMNFSISAKVRAMLCEAMQVNG